MHTQGIILPRLTLLLSTVLFVSACASSPNPRAQSNSVPSTPNGTTAPPTAVANPNPPTLQTVNVGRAQDVEILPTGAADEPLVARVNGQGITQADFDRALERIQGQFPVDDPALMEAAVLDTLIEQELIEQAAAEAGVIVSDEMLEAEYQANREFGPGDADWQQWLDENRYTEAEFRASLREALIAGTMRDRMTEDMPEVTLNVHARHILVSTEAEANDVLARLQNGEDFAALAASLSRDVTTREQGGDLGWFVEGELLEPVLSQVAFALSDGQIGGPVETRLGYHVIQKLESEERPLTPEQRAMLAQITFENWLRGLTFNAIIERYLP